MGGAEGYVLTRAQVHVDLEDLQKKLDTTSFAHKEDRDRLEAQIAQKESEQKAKLQEYDLKVQSEFDARERAERERESARGDAVAEKQRLASLLKVLLLSISPSSNAYAPSRLQLRSPTLTS